MFVLELLQRERKNERHIREGFVRASRKTSELRSHRPLTRAAYDEIRGERAIYANLRWVQPARGGEEALSDAICSNNSVNTRAAGLGPLATLAHFSEVTQGKVGEEGGRRLGETEGGREGEIDFICFLSSSKCLTTTAPPPPHITPVFGSRNHRLPSCFVSLFFQTLIHVRSPFSACCALAKPSEQHSQSAGCEFCF